MLNAEAATERQGWANFSTSSRAGKWLAETVGYLLFRVVWFKP